MLRTYQFLHLITTSISEYDGCSITAAVTPALLMRSATRILAKVHGIGFGSIESKVNCSKDVKLRHPDRKHDRPQGILVG